tara:strand:+ start:2356 stop:2910 length:555 start_codon:yes stop_codon:yes gene_type:complete
MHSHLKYVIVNRETGLRLMPAESREHARILIKSRMNWGYFTHKIKELRYDPQPEKRLKGYGVTKPGYLMIKYLADNPCAKMTEIVRHIMMEIKGELEYQDVFNYNKETDRWDIIEKRVYYGHFAYLFTPWNSNMTTYGRRTARRKWIHRFKGPDGVYRYHLTPLGLDASTKIWQRHHYKWAKLA